MPASSAQVAPPRPGSVPAPGPAAQGPTLVYDNASGLPFVVNLPDRHGWRRGLRIILQQSLRLPGSSAQAAIALGAVVKEYSDAAQVAILCQTPGSRLEGSAAKIVGSDEAPRAGRCGGRIQGQQGPLYRISLGQQDGVESGDRYQVLDPETLRPIGMLRVQQLDPLGAMAELLEGSSARARQIAIAERQAAICSLLGQIDQMEGKPDDARKRYQESLEIYRRLGMPQKIHQLEESLKGL